MVGNCEKCDNLDKSKKKWSDTKYSYQYGCRARNGYICFWCRADSELKTGGCSDFKHETIEQISLF